MIEEERQNCVAKCTSETCWNNVYGHDEIEDGEIDTERQRAFISCTRKMFREERKRKDKERLDARKSKKINDAQKEQVGGQGDDAAETDENKENEKNYPNK